LLIHQCAACITHYALIILLLLFCLYPFAFITLLLSFCIYHFAFAQFLRVAYEASNSSDMQQQQAACMQHQNQPGESIVAKSGSCLLTVAILRLALACKQKFAVNYSNMITNP
jgi:hypothetical protein